MPEGKSKARRSLDRIRRHREPGEPSQPEGPRAPLSDRGEVGWDHDAAPGRDGPRMVADERSPLTAQILSLFSEPAVTTITAVSAGRALERPRTDIQTAIDVLVQAGELNPVSDTSLRYTISPERKAQLEAMYREAAHELGETTALVLREPDELMSYEDDDEPRLPVTAGLLSLFLPGTGQLLNGDVGRASLVFAVWSLALLTHLSPIWTFVALYAGAEAFFTAKVRGMERKLALEAAGKSEGPAEA
ncbi:hypothetical protein ENSA5_10720 [Enhygromyxa salina]|uniref:Uncharacterized protein n=1 Tax=Enhygromyxa salina TaxID=215803 RepID=A0A2S9YG74_9BACT|nr:hypothetical protein [Enhygromyxa salina]PRQ04113.1 hypothetical protein ENSA5_10720 [Enhygromyxa salina]